METTTELQPVNSSKPVSHVRLGLISASIWENPGPNGPRHSVTFERRYKDEGGTWRSSQSYDENELLVLARVVAEAFDELLRRRGWR